MLKLHDPQTAVLCILFSITGFACLRTEKIRVVNWC